MTLLKEGLGVVTERLPTLRRQFNLVHFKQCELSCSGVLEFAALTMDSDSWRRGNALNSNDGLAWVSLMPYREWLVEHRVCLAYVVGR